MFDASRIYEGITNASLTLAMMSKLSVKIGFFGKMAPSDSQLAWSFGFCDGFAQSIGVSDDSDFALFISGTFENVFGTRGAGYFRKVLLDQALFSEQITSGGKAHHTWITGGRAPLMPR